MSTMFWTKTPPSKPGWYWERMPSGKVRCALLQETSVALNEIADGWHWSNQPIPEPSEPPEHELVKELRKATAQMTALPLAIPEACMNKLDEYAKGINVLADKLQAALSGKDAR